MATVALCGVAVLATGGCGGKSGFEVDIKVEDPGAVSGAAVWVDGTRTNKASATYPSLLAAEGQHQFVVELRKDGQVLSSLTLAVKDYECSCPDRGTPYLLTLGIWIDADGALEHDSSLCRYPGGGCGSISRGAGAARHPARERDRQARPSL